MHIRKITFGFGVITGATAALSIPLFIDKMRLKKFQKDQENHESTEVSKKRDFKDKVIDDAMFVSGTMKKEIDALINSISNFDVDSLKVKGKKSFEGIKKRAQSLKKMAE